jgi:NAD(P)H dehydrogenase (quinone)
MSERNPILITGAGGQVGAVSRVIVDMLLEQGHPVREAGAEVFVGDLLKLADVAAARRMSSASTSA